MGFKLTNRSYLRAATLVVLATACDNAEFRGPSERSPARQGIADQTGTKLDTPTIKIECGGGLNSPASTSLTMKRGMNISVQGEVCGDRQNYQNPSTMMLVVDISHSMSLNDPEEYSAAAGRTCGRLRAGQELVRKLETEITDTSKIKLGLIVFSDIATVAQEPTTLAQFKNNLIPETFCYKQTSSNFVDAFQKAQLSLQNIVGRKSVYLITDGLPIATNSYDQFYRPENVENETIRAAENLRRVPDLDLKAIYLPPNSGLERGMSRESAKSLLVRLTGSESNVVIVNSAGDLAREIVNFSQPRQSVISVADVSAQLIDADQQTKALAVTNFREKVTGKVWSYDLANFTPNFTSIPGTQNLTLKITSGGGKIIQEIRISVKVVEGQ